jgi:hypothetical protein
MLGGTSNMSEARNSLIREGMNMYVEPWEFIAEGRESVQEIKETSSVYVLESGVITKQIRIWSEEKFRNPVFETIDAKSEFRPEIMIG